MQTRLKCLSLVLGLLSGTVAAAPPQPPAASKQKPAPQVPPPAATPATAPEIPQQPPRIVMLRLGKDELTVADFMNYLQKNPSLLRSSKTEKGKASTIRQMLSDKLIREAIITEGLVPNAKRDDEQAMLKGYHELEKAHFPAPPPPSDSEAQAFYDQHRDEYGIPVMWRISQIQFRLPAKATDEQKKIVREKAEAALKRLNAGESFATVAADKTENLAARERKGDLGFLPLSFLSWMKEGPQAMKLNEPTGIVESPLGLEILMKTDERTERITPFEKVKDRVKDRMVHEGQERLKEVYLAELVEKTPITIVQEDLKTLFPEGVFRKAASTP